MDVVALNIVVSALRFPNSEVSDVMMMVLVDGDGDVPLTVKLGLLLLLLFRQDEAKKETTETTNETDTML